VLNEGCIVRDAALTRALIGVRTVIGRGVTIENSYIMGADFYEGDPEAAHNRPSGPSVPPLGIGDDSHICGAIVDKNARIGKGVKIMPKNPGENYAGHGYMVRDGITVVEKDAVIPDGAVV
jgi:glucose-1-phosphate adenylyltransferase